MRRCAIYLTCMMSLRIKLRGGVKIIICFFNLILLFCFMFWAMFRLLLKPKMRSSLMEPISRWSPFLLSSYWSRRSGPACFLLGVASLGFSLLNLWQLRSVIASCPAPSFLVLGFYNCSCSTTLYKKLVGGVEEHLKNSVYNNISVHILLA